MNKNSIEIRNASLEDISDINRLSEELGYKNSDLEVKDRLESILDSKGHLVLVAFLDAEQFVGWIHLFEAQRIESGKSAEIGGLVVTKEYRNIGIGEAPLILCSIHREFLSLPDLHKKVSLVSA